jgi:molybdate transport system substrate-binding protein
MGRNIGRLAAIAVLLFAQAGLISAAEIKVFATVGVKSVLEEIIPKFEKATGNKIAITWSTAALLMKRVQAGEQADALILIKGNIETLQKEGKIVPGTDVIFTKSIFAVGIKAGAPKPDISTPEAVKRMLLSAKSISYPDPSGGAAAGVSFVDTLKRLGIADQVQSKVKLGSGGADAMVKVAKGEVEIGLTYVSEMDVPGIDIVGPLPQQISPPTRLEGFISTHAKDPAAAKALLDYLSSPEAAAVYKAHKMEPGR